jgi:filamentous hemagglutinin
MKSLLIFFIAVFTSFYSEAQALKNLGEEAIKHTLKIVGKGSIESSDFIIKQAFPNDIAENILKKYDDDVIEKLVKEVSDNPRMKELLISNSSALKIWILMGNTRTSKNINVIKYFSNIMDDIGEQGFNNKYLFQETGDVLLVKSKNGRQIASIDDNVITTQPWKGYKDLNPFLNEYKMIPNSTYKINGQNYKTLENGTYKEISGTLSRLPKNKPLRSTEMQGLSKKIKDGVPTTKNGKIIKVKAGYPVYKDDGGHILANMFGGGSEIYNYLPMSKKLNKQGGAWANMEKKWEKALREGKKVDYKIKPIYEGKSQRPDKIYVTYEIDGKRITEFFDNNVF